MQIIVLSQNSYISPHDVSFESYHDKKLPFTNGSPYHFVPLSGDHDEGMLVLSRVWFILRCLVLSLCLSSSIIVPCFLDPQWVGIPNGHPFWSIAFPSDAKALCLKCHWVLGSNDHITIAPFLSTFQVRSLSLVIGPWDLGQWLVAHIHYHSRLGQYNNR